MRENGPRFFVPEDSTGGEPLSFSGAVPTLRCPSCGAPSHAAARACDHCGSLLATRRCPACFALNGHEGVRCGLCGATLPPERTSESSKALQCPQCRVNLAGRHFESIDYAECSRCGGLFLEKAVFDSVTRDAELRSRLHGIEPAVTTRPGMLGPVRYRKYPGCRALMNRVNYGRISGVVIDVCRKDGIWFDRGELSAIVAFLENDGSERIRGRERESMREEIAALEAARRSGAGAIGFEPEPAAEEGITGTILSLISSLFR